jgi:rhamnulokinase
MVALVAADLGAQSGRIALGRFDGEVLSLSEVHRFPNVPVRVGESLQWDILSVYRGVLDGLRAAADLADVRSVAVDAWGVDFGLLDAGGHLLGNPVHYRDERRAAAVEEVYVRVPPRELYERTGIQLMPINSVFELAAMAADRDPALRGAATLQLVPDLIHHWLCGSATTELTNASTTQCLDTRAGAWATDLLERLDIPTRLFPEVVEPGTVLGPVLPGVADETGLDGAEVIAVATHDTGSAVAAVPFVRPGSAFLSVGTWSLVGVEVAEPTITDASFAANLTNEAGVAGTTRLLRNVTGLWLLHECRRAWAASGADHSFEELIDLAEASAPHGAFIDPDDSLFAEPGDMPARIAAYCARTGQEPPSDAGATVRCILESLALRHAQVVETLATVTGQSPPELHIVGGGARNGLLCELTADATGLPVLAGPEEATLVGNLLVQAIALGEVASLDEAREVVRRSFIPTLYEPTATPGWEEARGRFKTLVDRGRDEVTA